MPLHKELNVSKWEKVAKQAQIMNIGAEISRAQNWQNLQDQEKVRECIERALELLDLTIQDQRWEDKLGDLMRIREALCYFYSFESAPIITKIFLDWLTQFAQNN